MTEAPDFTRLALKPSERLAIVTHVHGSTGLQETEYLEWKSGYDLSQRTGAAATARQLIGMANRDDARAAGHAEGHAYVLIGVEPGSVPGVPRWDSSDIENWLTRFVGPDLRYDVHYVPCEGKDVLFLTVDASRDGDPIFNLQHSSQDPVTERSLASGSIYVRHGANTEPPTSDDIKRLTARATVVPTTTLDLGVELDSSRVAAIDPQIVTDEHRDTTLSVWRSQMRSALPRKETGPLGALNFMRPVGENRTEEEYIAEIDLHIQTIKSAKHWWWGMMAQEWLKAGRSVLGVSVVNHSEENYENTVVEVTFSLPRFCIYLRAREVEEVMGLPEEPRKWGTSLIHSIAGRGVIPVHRDPEPEIERIDKQETLVRYPELRVRPHTTHDLQPVLLALGPPMAGTVIPVHWRVTASNTKSHLAGDIELRVPGGPAEQAEIEPEVAAEK
ncbi:MAG TPA: ATP-binding protein [Solirubrobacteraceae bacterium]|jgi:hypothetical protein|nr:ATP-binding protein [Solirubrobacteraceae bacterium]